MSDEYSVKKSRRKKKKNRRKKRIVLFVMELLILACLAVGVFVFAKVNAGLRNFQQLDTADENQNMDNVQMNEGVAVDKVMSGYTNILLLGLDHREDESFDYCNSDTMMICSINNDNGEVRLVSVYRDTYLNINPETYDFQKANAAYCWGSAAQCISMINKNLDLNITDYVAVDFKALAVLVDDIGGIDVTLTELEIGHLNNYCVETSRVTGMPYEELPQIAGTYTLNGVQAVAYARIRYGGGNDQKRTQRQRLVIEKIVSKARQGGIGAVTNIINDVFPYCKTSLSNAMIVKMATQMIGAYDIVNTTGFPSAFLGDSPYINSEYLVPVTLEQNVRDLHTFLFNDASYEPSDTVKEYSQYIIDSSGYNMDYYNQAVEASQIPASGSEADIVK